MFDRANLLARQCVTITAGASRASGIAGVAAAAGGSVSSSDSCGSRNSGSANIRAVFLLLF